MNNIIKSNEGLRKEYDDARAAKRQKKEQENADSRNLQCEKCNGKKIISINSKACDNNHVILPWGETIEGTITCHDRAEILTFSSRLLSANTRCHYGRRRWCQF